MNTIAEAKSRIRAAISTGRITQADLAREAGLSRSMLTGVLDEAWNPQARTLEKIVEALDRLGFFCQTKAGKLEVA